jgi:hypothetical protein
MTTEYYCRDCGKRLSEDEKPCSTCGSIQRRIHLVLHETLDINDVRLNTKLKRLGIPKIAHEMTKKKKISGETKKPVEETLIIDRTNLKKTVKIHGVKEYNGEEWKTVHFHRDEFKAKRRKK